MRICCTPCEYPQRHLPTVRAQVDILDRKRPLPVRSGVQVSGQQSPGGIAGFGHSLLVTSQRPDNPV
uniref:Uncharacterized protein n=1 Tax=Anguilla anguilla TaxID=7936 RepID=A0A0E9W360_ANGAN